MNKIILAILILSLASCKEKSDKKVDHSQMQEMSESAKETSTKKTLSPHTSAMAMIGDAHIHIDYSSPGVRGRMIFGGLLAYDAVWQAGAHKATWIETNKNLLIDGQPLAAGKYGFFVIPNKEQWTVIFNANWDQHGKDEYDEKDDVLRFFVSPTNTEEVQEHLTYEVKQTADNSGIIKMNWEKVQIQFPILIK
jgi:hypothetical protein